MEWAAISLLVWAGKGLLDRIGDDVLDTAYANLKEAGRPILSRLLSGLRSGDEAEVEAAAAMYANHLRENPVEASIVVAATVRALSATPVQLYGTLVRVMCDTVASLETRPRGVKSGCAAFIGSFPNPDFVTVLDIRDWRGGMQGLPAQSDFRGEPNVEIGYDSFDFPRMWMLEVVEERTSAELAGDLNSHLLNKHANAKKFGPLVLEDQLRAMQAGARLWPVHAILDDRVEVYYPGQVEELRAKLSADSIIESLRETELDLRREAEKSLFDIADTSGPERLLNSTAALKIENAEHQDEWERALARLSEEVRTAMSLPRE